MTIEDIILDRDRRGITALRSHLPDDYCDRAAAVILDSTGAAVIVTGFYILAASAAETDGPPGAIAIGRAIQALGREVVYVTDKYTSPLMKAVLGEEADVVDFPITDEDASKRFAEGLLARVNPSVVIAIERCGATADGRYRNMHGNDISEYNAKTDFLFTGHSNTVGVGDGGNEIGMGNLASVIATVPSLVKAPCVTTTTALVVSSVSNWGGYGLVAAMSIRERTNLLPSLEGEQELVRKTVDAGAVDGITTEQVYKVDGFTLEENTASVARLHEYLAQQGISS